MSGQASEGEGSGGPPVFEQGPIRPPSEARSLLLRVTRNCPWNKCEFCPVYKGSKFSRRSVDEVKSDIEAMAWWTERTVEESWRLGFGGKLDQDSIPAVYRRNQANPYLRSILMWMSGGAHTSFLQDADNLILNSENLAEMLGFLRRTFPNLDRVTTYSRSRTLSKRTAEEMAMLKEAGLDRVHVGLESGSDAVLEEVKKGATAEIHVRGGRRVKEAGLELSEYVMPGLGGRRRWEENALETARVLNAINPDFIRIRSLGVGEGMLIYQRVLSGEFEIPNDEEIARELKLLLESLEGIDSQIVSDHILNLLPEIEGKLPGDKEKMVGVVDEFLSLSEEDRMTYIAGRRFGLFEGVSDLDDPAQSLAARQALAQVREQGGDDVHAAIRRIVSRFI